MWDGIDPIQPIMPSWTWKGIENQERLRDLTPEQANRIRRLPSDQQEQALQEISRENRHVRSDEGMHERMRRMPIDETQERTRTGEPDEEMQRREGESDQMRRPGEGEPQETDDGSMRHDGTTAPEGDIRQQEQRQIEDERQQDMEERPDGSMREQQDQEIRQREDMPEDQERMRQDQDGVHDGMPHRESSPPQSQIRQSAESGTNRVEVELKPVPKSTRAPAPGESTVVSDNPIDEAGTHLEMARTSAMSEDWAATKSHIRQAGEALDQIVAKGDRNAERYLDRLKGEIRSMESAVDNRASDLDIRLENLERTVRHLKPEER
jgi:hypothetical protein